MTVITPVLTQHLDDAVSLRAVRSVLVRAPHVKLKDLARADERLTAHLDGLQIAGDDATALSRAALDVAGVGQLFVACILAIERRDVSQIDHLLSLLDVVPDAPRALASAFGWVAAPRLRGLTGPLLTSPSPAARWLGLVACTQHRVDPGTALDQALQDPDLRLRTHALRAAGELGRIDLLPACLAHIADPAPSAALCAARSAVLLGDRGEALRCLQALALKPSPQQRQALAIALFSSDMATARMLVKQLAGLGTDMRTLIRAAGWSGDVQVMPWLFKQMESRPHARLAGEAFCFMTGIDLAWNHLHCDAPDAPPSGPNDNPDDPDVGLDEDEDLRWPDLQKLTAWWQQNHQKFAPGTRYLVGATPTLAHCADVLEKNTQRQRFAAAFYMSLLQPGSVMFNCAAPSSRQARLLPMAVS